MKRDSNIVVVCHCILNCNSKVEGLSEFKGTQEIAIKLINNGYDIRGVIAIDGSPSCGYNKTCSSKCWYGELSDCKNITEIIDDVHMVEGKGIFIEELEHLLNKYNVNIPILGFNESKDKLLDENNLLKGLS